MHRHPSATVGKRTRKTTAIENDVFHTKSGFLNPSIVEHAPRGARDMLNNTILGFASWFLYHSFTCRSAGKSDKVGRAWRLAIALVTIIAVVAPGQVSSADESDTQNENDSGLCSLGSERAGRWITNGTGQMYPLTDVCSYQHLSTDDGNNDNAGHDDAAHNEHDSARYYSSDYRNDEYSDAAQDTNALRIDTPNPDEQFFRIFLEAASPEAIAFSHSVEQAAIIEYGESICPLLQDGLTMDDIRSTQMQAGLPADFDAAVNVSAIHTYCPDYESQIGR